MRHKVFAVLLTLFMLSFFFIAEQHQRNWLLYLTALSAHAFMLDVSAWRRAFAHGSGLAVLVLIGIPLLSLAWSHGVEPRGVRALLVAGYCIFAVYFGVVQLVAARPGDIERLRNALLGAAVVGGAIAVVLGLQSAPSWFGRLHGALGLTNPVHASILLLAVTLPAIRRMTLDRAGLRWLAACLVPWLFAGLAGARSAMGAYLIVGALLLTARNATRTNLVIGMCGLVVVAIAVALIGVDPFRQLWLERGISHRDVIFTEVWAQFRNCSPLIGCGIGTPLDFEFAGHQSSRPHSIFLGVLYYQGVLGLLAFLGSLGYLLFGARSRSTANHIDLRDWMIMLGFALLANLTSGDHILVRATLFWSYFWLPVMVLAAGAARTMDSPR
ncbi:MAG: hypothetical protein OES38_21665 [Gammaproteobacteria bacterium]|nr:hypothetical protein [Gammaproteobacteria bacterium]